MNSSLLYQWQEVIDKVFPQMGRWQKRTLALFICGMVLAQSCILTHVSRHVSGRANSSSIERRLQRWLANERMVVNQMQAQWVKWVLQVWGDAPLVVMVDETKLSTQVSVMMVGLAYQASAIPLVWRAYAGDAYPPEGQVQLLNHLLDRLHHLLPLDQPAVLLADRGLGTSPMWQAHLTETGWRYLLRVQRSTHIRLPGQKPQPLRRLVGYGQTWIGRAEVFKKAGWQMKWVYLVWELGYAEPLCLFSNQPDVMPQLYSRRFHHECGFRDLKSDGFDWQQSRVWLPAHVERLLLVLTLATFWSLCEGTKVLWLYPLTRRQQRLSVFRLGLDYLFERFHAFKTGCLELFLVPDTPSLKTVVP